jgi:hypothetical protein
MKVFIFYNCFIFQAVKIRKRTAFLCLLDSQVDPQNGMSNNMVVQKNPSNLLQCTVIQDANVDS